MKNLAYKILTSVFRLLFPISKKKILFIGYYGGQYGCNPKYLSEYFVNQNDNWDIVWAFTNPDNYDIPGIRKVKYFSLKYFYELSTSKVVITNYRMTTLFKKRAGQIYVQTWHSSLRLKMIEKDSESTLPSSYIKMAKVDSKNINVLLSGCKFSTDIFKRAFWYDGEILASGTPRCDALFNPDIHKITTIKSRLKISHDTKILLYAPTFRKDNNLECYNIDYNRLTDTLTKLTHSDWKILVRLHPHLKDYSKSLLDCNDNVIDATDYDDIQELLMISDYLVSDYSGLIFDFAITKRPCILYCPDFEEYINKDRNLYFNINKLPFPICNTNDELNNTIQELDINHYNNNLSDFLSTIGNYEDGNASKRVYEHIKSITQ